MRSNGVVETEGIRSGRRVILNCYLSELDDRGWYFRDRLWISYEVYMGRIYVFMREVQEFFRGSKQFSELGLSVRMGRQFYLVWKFYVSFVCLEFFFIKNYCGDFFRKIFFEFLEYLLSNVIYLFFLQFVLVLVEFYQSRNFIYTSDFSIFFSVWYIGCFQ